MWNRQQGLRDLHTWLHSYLSAAAVHTDLPTLVDDLWALPADFRRRSLAAHVLSSDRTLEALDLVEQILRSLPPSASHHAAEIRGVVHGPVLWQRTSERRIALADPTIFVTRPAQKSFDTQTTRFIRRMLAGLLTLDGVFPATAASGVSERVRTVATRSRALLRSRKLEGARRIHQVNPAMIEAIVARDSRMTVVADVLRAADDALRGGSPETLVPALLGGVFAPATDERLFELWVGLQLLDHLQSLGATVEAGPWDSGVTSSAFARIILGRNRYTLLWQRTYWSVPFLHGIGTYQAALGANSLRPSALIPDFVLFDTDGGHHLCLIEVKHSAFETTTPDRDGIMDCLAYLRDLESATSRPHDVRCLVVASHTKAIPQPGLITVCGPDDLKTTGVWTQLFHRT